MVLREARLYYRLCILNSMENQNDAISDMRADTLTYPLCITSHRRYLTSSQRDNFVLVLSFLEFY